MPSLDTPRQGGIAKSIAEVNLPSKTISAFKQHRHPRPKRDSHKYSHSIENEAKRRTQLIIESDWDEDLQRVEQLRKERRDCRHLKPNVYISRGRSESLDAWREENRLIELE